MVADLIRRLDNRVDLWHARFPRRFLRAPHPGLGRPQWRPPPLMPPDNPEKSQPEFTYSGAGAPPLAGSGADRRAAARRRGLSPDGDAEGAPALEGTAR